MSMSCKPSFDGPYENGFGAPAVLDELQQMRIVALVTGKANGDIVAKIEKYVQHYTGGHA